MKGSSGQGAETIRREWLTAIDTSPGETKLGGAHDGHSHRRACAYDKTLSDKRDEA